MKKTVRRFAAILLCFLLLVPVLGAEASAVSLHEGNDALRAKWRRATGPSAGGYALEYSYFEPEAAANAKLPLFVFMAGAGEGSEPGKELTANNICRWSSDEYQQKVTGAPGAYILILRAPEPVLFDTCPTAAMYAAVSDFASTHNVDRARICALGWCIGAVGACRMVADYPESFSGLVCFSMRSVISESQARAMAHTAVWLVGCTADSYSTYSLYTGPSWSNVRSVLPASQVRLTSCSSAPTAGLLFNHHVWRLAEYEFDAGVLGDYENLSTVDGEGNRVEDPSFITWLTAFSLPSHVEPAPTPSGGGFFASVLAFFRRIFSFFARLFG